MRKALSRAKLNQLAKIAALPDDQIHTVDIPEAPVENQAQARTRRLLSSRQAVGDNSAGRRHYCLVQATPLTGVIEPKSTAFFANM